MHQILRLLYADQQTPTGKLFRFESFDTRDIRDAVGQLLIGINGYALYEGQIKWRELNADYLEKDRLYKAALIGLPSSEGLTSTSTLENRIAELSQKKARTLQEVSDVDSLVGEERADGFVSERRAMQVRLRRLANQLNDKEQHVLDLSDENDEIKQFLNHLTEQMAVLDAAEELSDKLGSIEFQYCPACLKKLNDTDGLHCIVCHKIVDEDAAKSKYFEIKIDNELQIRESEQLLKSKSAELEELHGELRYLRRSYSTD
jgi:chromosome segregation ATPase